MEYFYLQIIFDSGFHFFSLYATYALSHHAPFKYSLHPTFTVLVFYFSLSHFKNLS